MLATVDRAELTWIVLLLDVVPLVFIVWAAWFIWRVGRRPARARVPAPPVRWRDERCRECGFGTPVHGKTHLCRACHSRPLPEKAEVPSHLPDRF